MSSQPHEAPALPGESPAVPGDAPGEADARPARPAAAPAARARPPAGAAPGGPADPARPWKQAADGRTVFRRGTPLVIFWVWVAFAIYNIAQIAIPDHNYFSLELTAGLLAVTAVVYASTVRPRVIADDDGLAVINPYRDHRIGWGGVSGLYLGDSVELSCARPAPRKDKTIYCWALYSGRRSRMRNRMRAERGQQRGMMGGLLGGFGGPGGLSGVSGRAPAEVQELARKDAVELMAAELGRRSGDARQRGVPASVLASAWAWRPLAYFAVPGVVLAVLLLAR